MTVANNISLCSTILVLSLEFIPVDRAEIFPYEHTAEFVPVTEPAQLPGSYEEAPIRALTRASYRITKSYFTSSGTRINRNKRIRIFSAEIFSIQVASLSILLIQSQVVSLNHFGPRIKHSCVSIYGELVCKEFSRSFSTNGDYY